MTVEVFKTNVKQATLTNRLITKIQQLFPACKVNFDLEDCDKILRVEGEGVCPNRIIELMNTNGHHCEVLV